MTISDNDFDQFVADPAAATQRWAAPGGRPARRTAPSTSQPDQNSDRARSRDGNPRRRPVAQASGASSTRRRSLSPGARSRTRSSANLSSLSCAAPSMPATRSVSRRFSWPGLRRRTSAAARAGAPGPFDANARQPSILRRCHRPADVQPGGYRQVLRRQAQRPL